MAFLTSSHKRIQGLFLFNKPEGITSAGFLNNIKRIVGPAEPIGHGGTLDPFATGLLVVGIGREYTRLLHHFLKGTEKTYEATIVLGAESTTYDREGIISHFPGTNTYAKDNIVAAIEEIKARPMQMPPPVSAKKIGGVPAYKLVRQGTPFILRPQETKLLAYELLEVSDVESLTMVRIKMQVSAGFYIRSFAHDLGIALGSDGYVESLARTNIGFFNSHEALQLSDLSGTIELVCRAKGTVQNIGFRAYAKEFADKNGIVGHARNMRDGIEIIGQGKADVLSEFLRHIKKGPEGARIISMQDYFRKAVTPKAEFEILASKEKEEA